MSAPHFISLGAGVQSSTMALMAAAGELGPMPEAAIFSDTQAEPASVYEWLDWLEGQLPFPVYRVTAGDLAVDSVRRRVSKRTGREYVREIVPLFLDVPEHWRAPDTPDGKGRVLTEDEAVDLPPDQRVHVKATTSMLWRRCTRDYKIRPFQRKLRELANVPRRWKGTGVHAVSWIGISTDEIQRMARSREEWNENRWPLIEAEMSRAACIQWMRDNGFPEPPRSACSFCPYHSNAEWQRLKDEEPDAFEAAAQFEDEVRRAAIVDERYLGTPYLHRSCVPLREARFTDDAPGQMSLWDDECDGMCGV